MKLTLMAAMTLDGKIARHNNHFPDWTGDADKRFFKEMTTAAGVVIMGSRTYAVMGQPLAGRLNVVLTRRPESFEAAKGVRFTADSPHVLLSRLAEQGFTKAILAGGATINTLFAEAGLIDDMLITLVPRIFGQGLSLFSNALALTCHPVKTREIERGVSVLHYRVVNNANQCM